MTYKPSDQHNNFHDRPVLPASSDEDADDLWFLPGPSYDESEDLPLGRRARRRAEAQAEPDEVALVADWQRAEAAAAAHLARVAGRLGALDDRLRRGPEGWRQRLALIEAADLSWVFGDRIAPDRLALWAALRLSGVQEDTAALARAGWAVRRLTGGPAPEAGLADFLGRHDPETPQEDAERLTDRADSWLALMGAARELHPITRACMGYHLWSLAGLGHQGDRIEAAVTAARIAIPSMTGEGQGAVFAPLVMGGAGGLRASGPPSDRLVSWLDGMERAILTAMRHLDAIETWAARAKAEMAPLSGRTPPALRAVLSEWPFVSAPMAEALTGASRAAVQRNLTWMQARGLVREVTGQGRFRMWRAADHGGGLPE